MTLLVYRVLKTPRKVFYTNYPKARLQQFLVNIFPPNQTLHPKNKLSHQPVRLIGTFKYRNDFMPDFPEEINLILLYTEDEGKIHPLALLHLPHLNPNGVSAPAKYQSHK